MSILKTKAADPLKEETVIMLHAIFSSENVPCIAMEDSAVNKEKLV